MMKRDSSAAPTGSSHQRANWWPMRGKRRERVLKTTSVLQSRSHALATCRRFVAEWEVGRQMKLMSTLSQSLYLRRLDPNTPDPDGSFDHHGGDKCSNRYWWQDRCFSRTPRQ